jgi:hypothetical protein
MGQQSRLLQLIATDLHMKNPLMEETDLSATLASPFFFCLCFLPLMLVLL